MESTIKSLSERFNLSVEFLTELHDKIVVRDEHGERIETTAGRIIFNEAVKNALEQATG